MVAVTASLRERMACLERLGAAVREALKDGAGSLPSSVVEAWMAWHAADARRRGPRAVPGKAGKPVALERAVVGREEVEVLVEREIWPAAGVRTVETEVPEVRPVPEKAEHVRYFGLKQKGRGRG